MSNISPPLTLHIMASVAENKAALLASDRKMLTAAEAHGVVLCGDCSGGSGADRYRASRSGCPATLSSAPAPASFASFVHSLRARCSSFWRRSGPWSPTASLPKPLPRQFWQSFASQGGNFRLISRLLIQMKRVAPINQVPYRRPMLKIPLQNEMSSVFNIREFGLVKSQVGSLSTSRILGRRSITVLNTTCASVRARYAPTQK